MSSRRSRRPRDDRDGTQFLALPLVVIRSAKWRALSYAARALLVDVAAQYSGANNGNLCASLMVLRPLGWRSQTTVTRAVHELVRTGFLQVARYGSRHRCALYALTWRGLDVGPHVEEITPATFRRGAYLRPDTYDDPRPGAIPRQRRERVFGRTSKPTADVSEAE